VLAFRSDRRRQRHFVWAMLVAWLLALSTGVVNACVLNVANTATRGLIADSQAAHFSRGVTDTEHHHGGDVTDHPPAQNGANGSCLKFCDDELSALSKGNTSTTPDAGVALVAAVQWHGAIVPVAHAGIGLSLQRPTAQGPPLVIRLLRLTL
jgi:hypothetical protein